MLLRGVPLYSFIKYNNGAIRHNIIISHPSTNVPGALRPMEMLNVIYNLFYYILNLSLERRLPIPVKSTLVLIKRNAYAIVGSRNFTKRSARGSRIKRNDKICAFVQIHATAKG